MKEVIKKAQIEAKKIDNLKKDKRVKSVMAFLVKKGLLISNCDFGKAPKQIKAEDCVFVAKNFEPRVFAVLPAALIHFQRSILDKEKLPLVIQDSVKAILNRKELDLFVQGVSFREMQYWAKVKPKDRRVRPVGEKKIVRTFRIAPKAFEKLEKIAKERSRSLTAVLEQVIFDFK